MGMDVRRAPTGSEHCRGIRLLGAVSPGPHRAGTGSPWRPRTQGARPALEDRRMSGADALHTGHVQTVESAP